MHRPLPFLGVRPDGTSGACQAFLLESTTRARQPQLNNRAGAHPAKQDRPQAGCLLSLSPHLQQCGVCTRHMDRTARAGMREHPLPNRPATLGKGERQAGVQRYPACRGAHKQASAPAFAEVAEPSARKTQDLMTHTAIMPMRAVSPLCERIIIGKGNSRLHAQGQLQPT